jgi:hypothetical protein
VIDASAAEHGGGLGRQRATMRRLVLVSGMFAALSLVSFGVPAQVAACSCAQLGSLAEYLDADSSLILGTTGARVGNDVPFLVERWFAGPGAARVVSLVPGDQIMPDGTTSWNSCGIDLPAGRHLLLVVYREASGRFQPSICAPVGDVDQPEGQALLAEAQATFGTGTVPEDPPTTEGPVDPTTTLTPEVLAAAGILAAATMILVGGVVLIARRRPPA